MTRSQQSRITSTNNFGFTVNHFCRYFMSSTCVILGSFADTSTLLDGVDTCTSIATTWTTLNYTRRIQRTAAGIRSEPHVTHNEHAFSYPHRVTGTRMTSSLWHLWSHAGWPQALSTERFASQSFTFRREECHVDFSDSPLEYQLGINQFEIPCAAQGAGLNAHEYACSIGLLIVSQDSKGMTSTLLQETQSMVYILTMIPSFHIEYSSSALSIECCINPCVHSESQNGTWRSIADCLWR